MNAPSDPNDKRNAGATGGFRLVDMHCHLDRMTNMIEVAHGAADRGIALFCTTLSPADALSARARVTGLSGIRVGCGLHPWWIATDDDGERDIELAAELVSTSRLVGEIGLDLSVAHRANGIQQLHAIDAIARACAQNPIEGRVLSIHAVHAVAEVLDVLERHELNRYATCIFHWFTGSGDQLERAKRAGCLFSVNERMLATKRGRAYAQQIPARQLLLETDAPPVLDTPHGAEEIERSLRSSLSTIARLHRADEGELADAITRRSLELLQIEG